MARITAIREHVKRRGRYAIVVDGEDIGTVDVGAISEIGLRVGDDIGESALGLIRAADRRIGLLDKALSLLAVHARSERDLRIRLRRVDPAPADLAWVLDRLKSLGYLDDAAFARGLAHARIAAGTSKRRLHDELYRKGVARDVASDALDQVFSESPVDEFEAALDLARKRGRSLAKLDRLVRRRRLYAFLARRGYESDVVARVLRALDAPSERD